MWISVNPRAEREEIADVAIVLSGWYEQGWSDDGETLHTLPLVSQVSATELAALYNNADDLELDIYTAQFISAEPTKGGSS